MVSFAQKRTGLLWLFFVAMLVIGLSACGGDDGAAGVDESASSSGSGSGKVPDACTLLTTDEVDTAVGGVTTPLGDVSEDNLFSTCTWRDRATGTGPEAENDIINLGRKADGGF